MPRGENRHSVLLSREENEQVFSMIGPKCQSLATAVVQLFTTEGPSHSEWKKRDTGVLCLIKDNGKRTYFFRIYCLYRKALIWEHEVYLQIEYKDPRPFLHTFEAEDYMTAFNFANEEEAKLLKKILQEKMELRRMKREEKRQRALLAARANSMSAQRQNGAPPLPPTEPAPPALAPKSTWTASNTNTLKGSKKPKRKITKADIGAPKDFKHISHVGWDAQRGFDKMPDDELKSFFSKAGVSETQLQDEETRVFIYDFIETHGGLAAVKNEIQTPPVKPTGPLRPPPPPSSAAPPVPSRSPAPTQPPAPPSRAPPPPPSRAVPPPPAPLAPRNPPPPRPIQPPSSAPPPVPPPPPPGTGVGGGGAGGAAPAPPPPPPPPLAPPPPAAPPAAPPMPSDAAISVDARAALLDSIRSGNKNLRKVSVKTPPVEDSRSNLLSEIRQGIELKAVDLSKVGRSGSGSCSPGGGARGGDCGLAGALARALEERSRAIHSSDSDLSDPSDADDEWDD